MLLFFWVWKSRLLFLRLKISEMSAKQTVAILTGGTSPEHEVSLNSARNIYNAIDQEKFQVEVIGISRKGSWRHLPIGVFQKAKSIEGGEGKALVLNPGNEKVITYQSGEKGFPIIDVVFNIVHGPFGEDGTMQGLLEVLGLPFVGPDTLGSSVGMDKDFTKKILRDAGVLVAPWVTVYKHEKVDRQAIVDKLGLPLFVKPANMGSSVGVGKAEDLEGLEVALKEAFKFDIKVLVEQGLKGREIETAVLGNMEDVQVSGIGEIIMESGFYDYESKYLSGDAAKVVIPAEDVSPTDVEHIRQTALKSFRALGLEGLSRMDVFLENDGSVYVNEPNTLPGFTNISMYPKLWAQAGIPYSELIERLLQLAIARHGRNSSLQRTRL